MNIFLSKMFVFPESMQEVFLNMMKFLKKYAILYKALLLPMFLQSQINGVSWIAVMSIPDLMNVFS